MPGEPINVFVSYSHADASLVAPVVKLLRVNRSLVFHDLDSIAPGQRWRNEIAHGLDQSHLVVVFWCRHASHSDEVTKEWQTALAQNKDLLPLLLDATPLPAPLSEFQWIDFRDAVGGNHAEVSSPPDIRPLPAPPAAPAPGPATEPPRPRPASTPRRWLALAASIAAFTLAGVLSVSLVRQPSHPDLPGTVVTTPGDPNKPPGQPAPVASDVRIPLAIAALLIVLAGLLWRWHVAKRRAETGAATLGDTQPPATGTVGAVEQQIAIALEAEILRRGALRGDTKP